MKKKKNKGFTLVELIVSIMISAIIFAGILVGIYLGMHSMTISRHRAEAIIIAQREMENIKANGYDSITTYGYTANGVLGETQVTASDVTEGANVIGKEVTVSVRWDDFGRIYTESVSSFIREPDY